MAKKTTKKTRKGKSAEEKAAEVKALMGTLEDGVKALVNSEDWVNWLTFSSKFHSYSYCNQILIHLQCPEATHVAGYQTWLKKMKRQVRKGEKGIRILAPNGLARFNKKTGKTDPVTGDDETKEIRFMRFKAVSVFDISQTDGDDSAVPSRPDIDRLEGDDNGVLDKLLAYAKSQGASVTFENIEGSANGYCYPNQKSITVDSGMSNAQKAKTLAHELGHMLLHVGLDSAGMGRDDRELEAESVAFIVCNAMGLETAEYSFGYLACWKGKGAEKGFRESTTRITEAASKIIEAANVEPEAEAEAA